MRIPAIYLLFWVLPKRFDIRIISGIFGATRISVDCGKLYCIRRHHDFFPRPELEGACRLGFSFIAPFPGGAGWIFYAWNF